MIRYERKISIPDKYSVQISERKELQMTGTATKKLTVIEEDNYLKLIGFDANARNLKVERKLVGV